MLAPMADVTDAAFRRVIARYGKPDVMWTEFVSADGLYHTREKQKLSDEENPLMRDLLYDESERPIVAQLFSSHPDMMEYAAGFVRELGFDGVDINMGCPDRSVEKQGAGAALMKKPALARELIRAAKCGAQHIPVSVKTRIGYNRNELETWLPELLAEEPAAVTVHARTRKEMSLVPARWEHVREAVAIRDRLGAQTLILGNGDCESIADAETRVRESGANGAMLGRAIFGNPWLFADVARAKRGDNITRPAKLHAKQDHLPTSTKLRVLVEHCALFDGLCGHKSFAVMKKHFKAYVQGFPGAKELREELMACNSAAEVSAVLARHSTE